MSTSQQLKKMTPTPRLAKVNPIQVTVSGDANKDMKYKLNRDSRLVKLKMHYCKHFNIKFRSARFLLDGIRIQNRDTPEKLEMEDKDIIEVYVESDGGGGFGATDKWLLQDKMLV